MTGIQVYMECWPIVVTIASRGPTDDEYRAYLRKFEREVLSRREPFVSLVDASRVTSAPTPLQRRMIAEWEKANATEGSRHNVGIAMVFTSRLVRGALTALHWLFPPPTPTVTFASGEDAIDWCLSRLEAHRVPVPEGTRERLLVRLGHGLTRASVG